MGAWGHGSFENDDALDWVIELEDSDSFEPISQALDAVLVEEGEYVEAPDASLAIAAAEVVAALRGRPAQLPDEVLAWLKGKTLPSGELVSKAQRALARVLADSELKELWFESDDAEKWQEGILDLQKRLSN